MVFVLEGTSVALALQAADRIQQALALPDRAFSYLRSHGTLDQEHTRHLAELLNAHDTRRSGRRAAQCTRLLPALRRRLPCAADVAGEEAVACN